MKCILKIALFLFFFATIFLIVGLSLKEKAYATDSDVIRSTEYYVDMGTSTTYNLTLNQNLSSNHFILVRGADSGNVAKVPTRVYAKVNASPTGMNGDLSASSGANVIQLSRGAATTSGCTPDCTWKGVVTVVECLQLCSTKGFRRLDTMTITLNFASTSGTDTSSTSWSNINNVVPFGGVFGGGSVTTDGTASANHYASCWWRLYPSGTNTINFERVNASNAGMKGATATVFIVEWGSEWTVQYSLINASLGGDGADATGEYKTATINSVTRANTWVWGTGTSDLNGVGNGSEGVILTLGDGVTQNTTETKVAAGSEFGTTTRNFDVYIMTHPSLDVQYLKKTDGDSSLLTYDMTVNSRADAYSRMSVIYANANGTNTQYPRSIWSSRFTGNSTIQLERQYSGVDFVGWLQNISFSGITSGVGSASMDQKAYRWRDDSTIINTSGGWLASENTKPTPNFKKDSTYRLRIQVANTGTAAQSVATAYELRWGLKTTTCSAISSWYGINDSDGSSAKFAMADSASLLADGATVTPGLLTQPGSYTYTDGKAYETSDTTATIGPITNQYYTELEFSFKATSNAVAGSSYCFKLHNVTNDGVLNNYTVYPEVTINQTPTVTSLSLNSGNDIVLTAGSTTNVSLTGTVTDLNGDSDISTVTAKIYRSGATNAQSCTTDDGNSCYSVASCSLSGCSNGICTATCNVTLQYHTAATDTSSQYSAEYWRGWISATDLAGESGTGFSIANSPDVLSLQAVSTNSSINYASFTSGQNSGSTNTTITITNSGNTSIDSQLSGTSMCNDYPTCSNGVIPVTNQQYSLTPFTYGSGNTLQLTPSALNISLPKRTTTSSTSTATIYMGISVPSNLPVGSYTGSLTISATSDI